MNKLYAAVCVLAVLATPAWAAPRSATLSLPGMNCPVCPITVKKALTQVDGVARAEVDFAKRQAVVNFDDAKTSVAALIRATTEAGYPSTLVGAAR